MAKLTLDAMPPEVLQTVFGHVPEKVVGSTVVCKRYHVSV